MRREPKADARIPGFECCCTHVAGQATLDFGWKRGPNASEIHSSVGFLPGSLCVIGFLRSP